jgi:hypothetical protein
MCMECDATFLVRVGRNNQRALRRMCFHSAQCASLIDALRGFEHSRSNASRFRECFKMRDRYYLCYAILNQLP